jgi:hypothetical protein
VSERTGVYVLGMHRSGTSALARVVDLLGVPLADGKMLRPSEANPAGYWEPEYLVGFNEWLLRKLGGGWSAPPPLEISAHAAHLLRDQMPAARELFRSLHPGDQWAWKDPRNCVLLPFWRAALDDRAVALLAYRNPAEVVASLDRQGQISEENAFWLWERYVRSAMFASRDIPRLVVDYADLVAQPEQAVERIETFLAAEGLRLSGEDGRRQAAASIDGSLYGARRAEHREDMLTGEQRDLVRQLEGLARDDGGLEVGDGEVEGTQQ